MTRLPQIALALVLVVVTVSAVIGVARVTPQQFRLNFAVLL